MLVVYNREFEVITVALPFQTFKWVRRWSEAGEFQIKTPFDLHLYESLKTGYYLYKADRKEAGIIKKINVIQETDGSLTIMVSGYSLAIILNQRSFRFDSNKEVDLKYFVDKIILENFGYNQLYPWREVKELKLIDYSIPQIDVFANYSQNEQGNCYDAIISFLLANSIGLKMGFSAETQTFEFSLAASRETDVVFSREFNNILEQDFEIDSSNFKNVIALDWDYYDGYIPNDQKPRGLERYEVFLAKPLGDEVERSSYLTMSEKLLKESKTINTLSTVVNPLAEQFEYLVDYDIGDIVTCKNELMNYSEKKTITEITEFYDEKGLNLELIFGEKKKEA